MATAWGRRVDCLLPNYSKKELSLAQQQVGTHALHKLKRHDGVYWSRTRAPRVFPGRLCKLPHESLVRVLIRFRPEREGGTAFYGRGLILSDFFSEDEQVQMHAGGSRGNLGKLVIGLQGRPGRCSFFVLLLLPFGRPGSCQSKPHNVLRYALIVRSGRWLHSRPLEASLFRWPRRLPLHCLLLRGPWKEWSPGQQNIRCGCLMTVLCLGINQLTANKIIQIQINTFPLSVTKFRKTQIIFPVT